MYYVSSTPTENGSYGAPQSMPFDGAYCLPNNLLQDYINTLGFATLTVTVEMVQGEDGDEVEQNVVTAVDLNEAAYDAYISTHPDPGPEPDPQPEENYDAALRALLTGEEGTQ